MKTRKNCVISFSFSAPSLSSFYLVLSLSLPLRLPFAPCCLFSLSFHIVCLVSLREPRATTSLEFFWRLRPKATGASVAQRLLQQHTRRKQVFSELSALRRRRRAPVHRFCLLHKHRLDTHSETQTRSLQTTSNLDARNRLRDLWLHGLVCCSSSYVSIYMDFRACARKESRNRLSKDIELCDCWLSFNSRQHTFFH